MGSEVVLLLHERTAMGIAYRVNMRLRPDGEQGLRASCLTESSADLATDRGATMIDRARPMSGAAEAPS